MKKIAIPFVILFCLTMPAASSELSAALAKASGEVTLSDAWHQALGSFVKRPGPGELGRLTSYGQRALRVEFAELRSELLELKPLLDLKTELHLATNDLKSNKLRALPKFLSRFSRICSLVGRMTIEGKASDDLMTKCDRLESFVLHHGVCAYLPDR